MQNSNRLIKYIITEFITINSYSRKGIGIYMKQEYKIKEVFDESAKTIQEKLQETFINYLIEKVNKQEKGQFICVFYILTSLKL